MSAAKTHESVYNKVGNSTDVRFFDKNDRFRNRNSYAVQTTVLDGPPELD
ncbi:MAG: hypothetical protein WKF77_00155 [Planctomycetaceae bacterium]